MKIAMIVFAILGALASLGLGSKWVSDYDKYKGTIEQLQQSAGAMGADVSAQLNDVTKVRNAGYAMIPLGLVALIVPFLFGRLGNKVTGGVLIACAVIPAVFSPQALIFTGFLVLAGVFAFLVKPKNDQHHNNQNNNDKNHMRAA